jgi:hypothetical protein
MEDESRALSNFAFLIFHFAFFLLGICSGTISVSCGGQRENWFALLVFCGCGNLKMKDGFHLISTF